MSMYQQNEKLLFDIDELLAGGIQAVSNDITSIAQNCPALLDIFLLSFH